MNFNTIFVKIDSRLEALEKQKEELTEGTE